MNKSPSDPFSSTFSLLAGQGISTRSHHDLTHVEPMPDNPQYIVVSSHPHRRLGLIALILAVILGT